MSDIMNHSNPTCDTCKFYCDSLLPEPAIGECRKRPPRPRPDVIRGLRVFPMVKARDWCGEYRYDRAKDEDPATVSNLTPPRTPRLTTEYALWGILYTGVDHWRTMWYTIGVGERNN